MAFGQEPALLEPFGSDLDGCRADVAAEVVALQAFGDGQAGVAAAEEASDRVTLVGAGFDNPLQQGFGLLGGVAEALLGDGG